MGTEPQSAASVHLVETDVVLPAGGQERLSLKTWLNDGKVLWEIRRLVFFQLKHEYTKAFDLSSWMSHNKPARSAFMDKFGVQYSENIFPSRLDIKRGAGNDEPLHCKGEHAMTTIALLLLMVWPTFARKKMRRRIWRRLSWRVS